MTQPSNTTALLFVEPLLQAWAMNADYGKQLVEDLEPSQMVAQPHEGMNHPAWLLSHMNLYAGLLASLLSDESPADPIDHPFGMKSSPSPDPSVYASKAELVDAWVASHERVSMALQRCGEELLMKPMPIERFRGRFATVGSCLVYIMIRHESLHLGQLSAWRRAIGLPRV